MSKKSSGIYIVDKDFNVVTYNQTAKELYPQINYGQKCHKCLMNLDEPCGPCPIANHVQGPRTYMDPIRNIRETVDSVEVNMEDGTIGHALVFSTVGELEEISSQLPLDEREFRKLFEQENYDFLTGGYSRKGFIANVEQYLQNATANHNYAILFWNTKHFKAINEMFGSKGGDVLLKQLHDELQTSFLKPLCVGRNEADHLICLVDCENLHLERLGSLCEKDWTYNHQTLHINIGCGIYLIQDKNVPVPNMIDYARLAQKNMEFDPMSPYRIFHESLLERYFSDSEVLSQYQYGISKEEFKVYFQPVIDAKTHEIISAEALVRWQHPKKGLIGPNEFVPVLERNGFIHHLDLYVLTKVEQFQNQRVNNQQKVVPISVNLSWQDFYDKEILQKIHTLSKEKNVLLNFEVTETSMASLERNHKDVLDMIRQSGSRILLDDFGTGYASFGMLQIYNFDILKIDMSFTRQIRTNQKVRKIICSIIQLAHDIDLRVVAEGVEHKEELDFLTENSCDYIQGYYFSKPLPQEDFELYLQNHTMTQSTQNNADEKYIEELKKAINDHFYISLLDHVDQYIQVCDPKTFTMLYGNHVTRNISPFSNEPYEGRKCYEYMCGLKEQCPHCPMRKMDGENEKHMEVDDGNYTFSVSAMYIDVMGHQVFVEFGHDITNEKRALNKYHTQVEMILQAIPDEQGIFYVDLTDDKWISSIGNAVNARSLQNMKNVDHLIGRIASFVPDRKGQQEFIQTFNRNALLKNYEDGKHSVELETYSYYDDRSIRWSRITAKIIKNPENQHLEAIIYGSDISHEKQQQNAMEKQLENAKFQYSIADIDRRTDYLTGLRNRLDMDDQIQQLISNPSNNLTGMCMIDIDDFKLFNDTNGHLLGDACLTELGVVLNTYAQTHSVKFFRYGGEEFIGMMYGEETPDDIAHDLLNICRNISFMYGSQEYKDITVSIGYTTDTSDIQKMIDRADQAMYYAKKHGKDQVACAE